MSSVDFDRLIVELATATVAPEARPSIWGGEFEATTTNLSAFLQAWKLEDRDMPWRIWEWVSDIVLEHGHESMPDRPDCPEQGRILDYLERGRAFGPHGDLSLRRDGGYFLWHFVGPRQTDLPAGFQWEYSEESKLETENSPDANPGTSFPVADYWHERPVDWDLQVRPRSVLLWGQERRDENKKPLGTWHDDRVSGVRRLLKYPTMSGRDEDGRVKLCYREYLRGDSVEAIWWLDLKGLNELCGEESHE